MLRDALTETAALVSMILFIACIACWVRIIEILVR